MTLIESMNWYLRHAGHGSNRLLIIGAYKIHLRSNPFTLAKKTREYGCVCTLVFHKINLGKKFPHFRNDKAIFAHIFAISKVFITVELAYNESRSQRIHFPVPIVGENRKFHRLYRLSLITDGNARSRLIRYKRFLLYVELVIIQTNRLISCNLGDYSFWISCRLSMNGTEFFFEF